MNYTFEYIDIILLAMIAGFIFLRLRGILGKRTGHEDNVQGGFKHNFTKDQSPQDLLKEENFDEKAKKDFLKGAKIAYETIITDFGDSDNKLTRCKSLLSKNTYNQFKEALSEREARSHYAEITFIGINSASIKEHKRVENNLEVTVDFISELITCVRDKQKILYQDILKKLKKFTIHGSFLKI